MREEGRRIKKERRKTRKRRKRQGAEQGKEKVCEDG
jgi:hypothetical protein